MNEVRALVEAFDAANSPGRALRAGDGGERRRVFVPAARARGCSCCEGGASTGTISAGCLESDVVEHAKRVIETGAAKLVEYDTASTSDEMAWGLGLGCNGIVRVLVEPLAPGSLYVEALRRSCAAEADAASLRSRPSISTRRRVERADEPSRNRRAALHRRGRGGRSREVERRVGALHRSARCARWRARGDVRRPRLRA